MSSHNDCQHATDSPETPEVIEARNIYRYCENLAANVTRKVCQMCKAKVDIEAVYENKTLHFKQLFKPRTKLVSKGLGLRKKNAIRKDK